MSETITADCVQLDYPTGEGASARLERVRALLLDRPVAQLVVLPELWDVRYFDFESYRDQARPLDAGMVPRLQELARELSTTLVGGSVVELRGERIYNTVPVIGPSGDLLGAFRKRHLLVHGSREADLLTPGDEDVVLETPVGRIGVATCFDLRFPEQFAAMREMGADLFVVPAAWPAVRAEDWRLLCRVRAMENQVPLLGCNGSGDCAGVELAGGSLAVDARGRVQDGLDLTPGVLSTVVDRAFTAAWRAEFPMRPALAGLSA
jgi:predicted amidohydrolase